LQYRHTSKSLSTKKTKFFIPYFRSVFLRLGKSFASLFRATSFWVAGVVVYFGFLPLPAV